MTKLAGLTLLLLGCGSRSGADAGQVIASDGGAPLSISSSCGAPRCQGTLPSGEYQLVDACSAIAPTTKLTELCPTVVILSEWHHAVGTLIIDGGEVTQFGEFLYDADVTFPPACLDEVACGVAERLLGQQGIRWAPGYVYGSGGDRSMCEAYDAGCTCHVETSDDLTQYGSIALADGRLTLSHTNGVPESSFSVCADATGITETLLDLDGGAKGPRLLFR